MTGPPAIQPLNYYHIYNQGNNGEIVFPEEKDFLVFLRRYYDYTFLTIDTYAYCLLPDQYHFLIRVRSNREQRQLQKTLWQMSGSRHQENTPVKSASQQLSNCFNSYTKTINNRDARSGSLFRKPFRRQRIQRGTHFTGLVCSLHWAPQFAGLCDDYRAYPYSSFIEYDSDEESQLNRAEVICRFGGIENFQAVRNLVPQRPV